MNNLDSESTLEPCFEGQSPEEVLSRVITRYSNNEVFIEYNEDSQGRKQGEYIKYFNNPHVPEISCNYHNNMLHGKYTEYKIFEQKPVLVLYCNYSYGKLNGVRKTWCGKTGRPITVENYSNGKLHGIYLEYYINSGNLYKKYNYINGNLSSESKSWYETGHLQMEINDTERIEYTDKGTIYKKILFSGILEYLKGTKRHTRSECNKYTRYEIDYNTSQDGITECKEERAYINNKLVKGVQFPQFDWKKQRMYNMSNPEKVCNTIDYIKNEQVITRLNNPNERLVYSSTSGYFIRSESIDSEGNIIVKHTPTIWENFKKFFWGSRETDSTGSDDLKCKKKMNKYILQDSTSLSDYTGHDRSDLECKYDIEEENQLIIQSEFSLTSSVDSNANCNRSYLERKCD